MYSRHLINYKHAFCICNFHNDRLPPAGVDSPGLLVLVNLSDDDVTADTSIFAGVPTYGRIAVRSVNFKNQAAVVG